MAASSNMNLESRVGFGPIPPAQGIYEESATQKAELGRRICVGDRVYRYAYAGGVALLPGKLVYPAALTPEIDKNPLAAVAAGKYEVTIVTAAAQTNMAEGYLCVNNDGGEGMLYRIKTAVANATTSTSTDLVLYDPIVTALATTTEVILMSSMYYDLDLSAAITDTVAGIAPIPVTANYYFWCQTWGPCLALGTAATAAGSIVVPHTTDGAIVIQSAYTSGIVGTQLVVGVSGEYRPIYLRIAP